LWLVKNGVPFDVAMSLDPNVGTAFSIIFSEFEGAEFDYGAWRFRERK
jgi:hypothetical protein